MALLATPVGLAARVWVPSAAAPSAVDMGAEASMAVGSTAADLGEAFTAVGVSMVAEASMAVVDADNC